MTEQAPPTPPSSGTTSGTTSASASSGQPPKKPLSSRFQFIREVIDKLPPEFQRPAKWYLNYQYGLFGARAIRAAVSLGIFGYFIAYPGYKAWKTQREFVTIRDGSILTWKANRLQISEAPPEYSLADYLGASGPLPQHLTLLDAIKLFRWAKDDDRIKGLVADFSQGGLAQRDRLGFAQAQELREAIEAFRETKREKFGDKFKMVAYTDTFDSQLNYFLASTFDEVRMEPLGSIPLTGLNSVGTFFKNLLDKVGIDVQAEAREEHKSMISTFTKEGWTPPQKENLTSVLTDINNMLINGIAQSRKRVFENLGFKDLGERIKKLMDVGDVTSAEAIKEGLIDSVEHKITTNEEFGAVTHQTSTEEDQMLHLDEEKHGPAMSLHRYRLAKHLENQKKAQPTHKLTVGLVYLCGNIMQGDKRFGGNWVSKALIDAGKDKDVHAVILRIDSGGGDAIASETIYSAVQYVRKTLNKPVIASFGNVAASGGYYAACGADKIISNPGTITGSIGVAALRPHVTKMLLDNVGVTIDEVYTAEGGKNHTLFRKLDGEGLERFKTNIDTTYDIFLQRVAEGRGKSVEEIRQVAGGRIWSGQMAQERGLVDETGGLYKAIETAVDLVITKAKQEAPPELRTLVEKLEAVEEKHNLEKPRPHIQVKVYPRHRKLWERLRDPKVEDMEKDPNMETRSGVTWWFRNVARELSREVVKGGLTLAVEALGFDTVKKWIVDAAREEVLKSRKAQVVMDMGSDDLRIE